MTCALRRPFGVHGDAAGPGVTRLLTDAARYRGASVVLVGLGGACAGALTALSPTGALAVALGALALLLLAMRDRLVTLFLFGVVFLLVGYAFSGRPFAHLGAAPIYVGEPVLALALLAFCRSVWSFKPRTLELLVLSFMILGAVRTLPYLERYGLDALRDATLWGYAVFALGLASVLTARHITAAVAIYRRLVVAFLVLVPLTAALAPLVSDSLPTVPGSNVGVLNFKEGDIGVHLAGAAAFVIVGLFQTPGAAPALVDTLLLPFWLFGVGVALSLNRGGFVAANAAWLSLGFFRPPKRWLFSLLLMALVALALVTADPSLDYGTSRQLSLDQIGANLGSIFADTNNTGLQGTKEFRLAWWGAIVDYTLNGPYFWTGKGFGVNLADDDGFQVTADDSLRAPHNTHFTVLARMGVPGLLLWAALQVAFGIQLLMAYFHSRRVGNDFWCRVDIWLFVYWIAMLVDTSFDPYLEGPQGGIWFWAVIGLGVAAINLQRRPSRGEEEVEKYLPMQPSVVSAASPPIFADGRPGS